MTEEQKKNKKQFKNCCEGMDFSGMMEAMMSQREEVCGCGCMEMAKRMMAKSSWPGNHEKETSD
jgi:hypothetical protein